MATPEQRARRRAQREIAKRVRAPGKYKKILPKEFRTKYGQARQDYARAIMAGEIDRPDKNSLEGRSLAALASAARWGNAPKEFESAFKDYWYHKSRRNTDEDEEQREPEDEDEDEE